MQECNHGSFFGLFDAPGMKINATLDVPQGSNFDLYMYMDVGANQLTCSTLVQKSTGVGSSTESVSMQWGGGFWTPGSDYTRPIRFEVRHVDGACGNTGKWKLTVYGNHM
jgi:hypothetical protein